MKQPIEPSEAVSEYIRTRSAEVNGCWIWTGPLDADGYGRAKVKRQGLRAHRLSFAAHGGELIPGMHIDHLCRETRCVNPEHLEQVTPAENHRRQREALEQGEFSIRCKHGHELDERNRYVPPSGGVQCRACNRAKAKRQYWKAKEAVA